MNFAGFLPVSSFGTEIPEIDFVWERVAHPTISRTNKNDAGSSFSNPCWGPIGGKVGSFGEKGIFANRETALAITPLLEFVEEATNFLIIENPTYPYSDFDPGRWKDVGKDAVSQEYIDNFLALFEERDTVTYRSLNAMAAHVSDLKGPKGLDMGFTSSVLDRDIWHRLIDLLNYILASVEFVAMFPTNGVYFYVADRGSLHRQLEAYNRQYENKAIGPLNFKQVRGIHNMYTREIQGIETSLVGRARLTKWLSGTEHPKRKDISPYSKGGFSIRENVLRVVDLFDALNEEPYDGGKE
jgi:hypothetical protein